jgi:hypothetical protein
MTLYTPIPAEVIDNRLINDRQFHTYCRIMKKCWHPEEFSFEWTEPLSMSSLSRELGVARTTLIEHINTLDHNKLIKIHHYSDTAFALIPTASVGQPTEVSVNRPITINTSSINKEDSLSDSKEKNVGQPTGVGKPTVMVEIVEILKGAGVGDPMRWKIANSAPSVEYVRAWLNWMVAESHPLNHAIAAMRDGLPAPEYCPVCQGWNGEHKGVVDEDNGYLMCPRDGRPDYGEMSPV